MDGQNGVAEQSATAAAELARLLNRVIENVNIKSVDGAEWWSTEIDTLCLKMKPLWAQVGITKPGVAVERWNPPINDPSNPMDDSAGWHRSLITRDPDTESHRGLIVESSNGELHWNTTAKRLKGLLYVLRAWVVWIDQRWPDTLDAKPQNDGHAAPDTEITDDWRYALSLLESSDHLKAIAKHFYDHGRTIRVSKSELLDNRDAFPKSEYADNTVAKQIRRLITAWITAKPRAFWTIKGTAKTGWLLKRIPN